MVREGLLVLLLSLSAAGPASADVNIGINVGTPAPPPPAIAVTAPPQLVVVPGSTVYYAPAAGFNLFVFNGRYWSFHNGTWFYASSPRSGWAVVEPHRVPRQVLAVPVTYYRVPPGHARKLDNGLPGGRGHKGRPGHND